MQLTFNTDEPIDKVLAVVSAVYGVELAVTKSRTAVAQAVSDGDADGDGGTDERITRPRPT